ncbi:hypothetical protein [Pseudomonas aeruginosa]|uniref:hypothetical protein n=1 Tax=Pseudomonas aeruginosa TaxID=287 RepID=UPI001CEF904E|nr:hypothetical protein [Pseudomonas aeruginosa]
MTASKIQMDQIRSTSATVTGENIRAGSQKKSSLSPAEGLQGASPDATCTCPSGGGSLRHPCPAHPAVEQAGGDERDFQAEGAQEVPSPVSQEYDRHLISLLRKGEALPGHQEEAADEIERLRDWNDHLNNTVLPNILNPNFLMLMKGGERLLDLCTKDGKFIGVSLNDMKDVFDWMVTHARIAPDHAALAQPSPASDLDPLNLAPHAEAFNEAPAEALKPEPAEADRPEVAEVAFVLRNIGAMDAEDIDGDNVDLRFEDAEGRDTGCDVSIVEYAEKAADLFEQHDRIVGELRAVIAQLRQHKNDYMDSGQQTYRALQNEIREREAEIARLDGLVSGRTAERDAALAEVERLRESKGDPSGSFDRCMKMMYERDENAKRLDAALARVAELEKQEPVAHLRASDLERLNQPGIAGSAGSLWNGPREGFVPLYAAPVAQAQHSVPAAWYYDAPSQAEAAIIDIRGMWGEDDCPTYEDVASALRRLLAAAPGCHLSRNALTEAQMRRLYENSTETENERLGFEAFARLIRRAEAVHQIAAAPAQGGE